MVKTLFILSISDYRIVSSISTLVDLKGRKKDDLVTEAPFPKAGT